MIKTLTLTSKLNFMLNIEKVKKNFRSNSKLRLCLCVSVGTCCVLKVLCLAKEYKLMQLTVFAINCPNNNKKIFNSNCYFGFHNKNFLGNYHSFRVFDVILGKPRISIMKTSFSMLCGSLSSDQA